jgi:predicted permease
MRWLERIWRRTRVERALDAELRDHLARDVAAHIAAGLNPTEAHRQAQLALGGLEQVREACRDVHRPRRLAELLQDLRHAGRGLRRTPALTLAIVLSLGLGIGANTAIYAVVRAALLRPLPVPSPQDLVQLKAFDASGDFDDSVSYQMFLALTEAVGRNGQVFAVNGAQRARVSTDADESEYAIVEAMSANAFQALGVPAAIGRVLVPSDDAISGGQPVAVLSHAYWVRRFAQRPDALDRTLRIGGIAYQIVGVAAPPFTGVDAGWRPDVWLPATARLPRRWLTMSGSKVLQVMARLDPDADRGQLDAAIDGAFRREWVDRVLPTVPADQRDLVRSRHLRFRPAASGLGSLGAQYRRPFAVLMASVAAILVLCCANVANLLLARHRVREREFAVRLSLGAGRGRLARQLLAESALLGSIGATLGLFLAWWGARALIGLLPETRVPLEFDVSPDRTVLLLTMALAAVSTLAVGVLPAWRAARTPLFALARETRGTGRLPVARSLVVLQVGGSLTLLVLAALMGRTLDNLRTLDLGFVADRVATFDLSFPDRTSDADKAEVYARIVDRLGATSGISGVTYSFERVYDPGGWAGAVTGPVGDRAPATARSVALLRVGPRFFDVLGMRRLAGRSFTAADHDAGSRGIIVNETFARHFFGHASPVGQHVDLDVGSSESYEVLGVVRDAQHYGAREQPCGGRVAYFAIDPSKPGGSVFVRTTSSLADLDAAVRHELGARRGVMIDRLRPLDQDVHAMVGRERLVGFLSGGFALLALAIAAIGLYGLLAYSVSERRPELGLRAALGAEPRTLASLVLREAGGLIVMGGVLGLFGAVAATRLVATLLFGVGGLDPAAFLIASTLLLLVALMACYLPARRASRVDPTVALRAD